MTAIVSLEHSALPDAEPSEIDPVDGLVVVAAHASREEVVADGVSPYSPRSGVPGELGGKRAVREVPGGAGELCGSVELVPVGLIVERRQSLSAPQETVEEVVGVWIVGDPIDEA